MTKKPQNEPKPSVGAIAVVAASRIAEAEAEVAEANAGLKEKKKWAEARGVNLKALEAVRKAIDGDKIQEFVAQRRDELIYAAAFGRPVEKSQLEIWNLLEAALPLDEAAYNKGRAAGLYNSPTQSCPYGLDQPAGQQWMSGWHQGQKELGLINDLAPKEGSELIKSGDPDIADEGDEVGDAEGEES